MNTRKWLTLSGIVALVMLVLSAGLIQAQGAGPEGETTIAPSDVSAIAAVSGLIPVQGYLTDNSGNPLDGNYEITLSLYEQSTGGSALCSDTDTVDVDNGLFNFMMGYCWNKKLQGQQVWLGVTVGTDDEMAPRQPIYPVPYAYSLRPGAIISDTNSNEILEIRNNGTGNGLNIYADDGHALWTQNWSSDPTIYAFNYEGAGVSGTSGSGTGVWGGGVVGVEGLSTDVDIKASGTGVIHSVADTDIAISPLNIVPGVESRTDLEFIAYGSAMEIRSSASGFEYIQIPVTVPSELFGSPTKFKSARICYKTDQSASFISTTIVSMGEEDGTATQLVNSTTDRTSTSWACYNVTGASPQEISGPLYIQLSLDFDATGSLHDIRIGNITVTLTEE